MKLYLPNGEAMGSAMSRRAHKRIKRFEQIGRHERSPTARRYLKRAGARALRRAAKRLLDDAPTRLPYLGYTT